MTPEQLDKLATDAVQCAPHEAAENLSSHPDADIVAVLDKINPMVAQQILGELGEERRKAVLDSAPPGAGRQWARNREYAEGTVGRLMELPVGVFRPSMTIADTVEALRKLTKRAFITYGFVTDEANRLLGVVVMREMLLGTREQRLDEIMLRDPFFVSPEMTLTDAMKAVLNKHFPVYPVCDEAGRLLGLLRGQNLFEAQAIEISAQAGSMVGVEKEERLSTPFWRSLLFRHPWLQLNLLTAFVAAAVVGFFQGTLDRIVLLAVFLPVLAGQSGNTGCQALAVALRGLTLGELKPGSERRLVLKEGALGLLNGMLVGVTSGLGMWIFAGMQGRADGWLLAVVTMIAMTASCLVSGVSGVLVPLTLKRLGADPATASSIFLTTATDVASMGFFLGLATLLMKAGLLTGAPVP
jgi:magnesium transporter